MTMLTLSSRAPTLTPSILGVVCSSRSVSSLAVAAGPRSIAASRNRKLSLRGVDSSFLASGQMGTNRLIGPSLPSYGGKTARGGRVAAPRAASAPAAASEGMKSLWVAVGIPLVLGVVDALFNSPGTKWYFDLKKPRWQPPSFLFGGAWSVLYPLMGLSSWLVWAEGGFAKQSIPLALYALQLALNLAWPALFFGAKRLGAAFVDIVLLDVAVVATIAAFKPVNQVAANLLKPYLAWVLFATALNYKLWDLNKNASQGSSSAPAI